MTHIKKVSKPARAAAGYDPAPLITAKANMINAIVGIIKIERFFGIPLYKT
jgi:hypothetical protein